jgi:FKBP-type peptidyl-prolyl cis-trans isomerase (trigger factor)
MKIEKKLLENSVVELIIEDTTENLAKSRKAALAHLEKNAEIKGFRKGTSIPE